MTKAVAINEQVLQSNVYLPRNETLSTMHLLEGPIIVFITKGVRVLRLAGDT